jgi:hypothetical protein
MQSVGDSIESAWRASWLKPFLGTWAEYSESNLKLPGSALSVDSSVDFGMTPWIVDPLNDCDFLKSGVRFNTLVKPVQSGGSVAGELAINCGIKFLDRGDIQYNWENDEKAEDRWKKRFEKILEANASEIGIDKAWQICLLILGRLNFTMQGVESESNLSSDSIRFQVNEEVHNWPAGKLALAYNRKRAYEGAGFHIFNISNAGNKGDQLHKALLAGTNREWVVKCPGCGLFHSMRIRWDDGEPQAGGLRYDSAGCKRDDGSYDYNKLAPTVRYQMPCGYTVPDDELDRKRLSDSGKYSDPRNTGAHLSNESRTFEAVSVHYISWLQLIEQKHAALKSLYYGDPEPWKTYLRENECRFWDADEAPIVQQISLQSTIRKNRDGLAGRTHRFFALDKQKGSRAAGEFPHWWLLICDVGMIGGRLKIQLVFEGKIETDNNVVAVLEEHEIKDGVNRHFGVADCTHDTTNVKAFCFKNGINAIFARDAMFSHADKSKQAFSEERTLASELGVPMRYALVARSKKGDVELDKREPLYWMYSEPGVKDLLHFLKNSAGVDFVIPADVSKDFRSHMDSWRLESKRETDGSITMIWVQTRKRDDLYICFGYIAMLMRMAGLTGDSIVQSFSKTLTPQEEKK